MRSRFLIAALLLPNCSSDSPSPEGVTYPRGELGPAETDTVPTYSYAECVFDLALWCFDSEAAGGPTSTTGTCPTPTADELLERPGTLHERCVAGIHGLLEIVAEPTGYGGPTWYFDRAGHLVAYTNSTDVGVFCEGASFSVAYGFAPDCEALCLDQPDTGEAAYSYLPPCDPLAR